MCGLPGVLALVLVGGRLGAVDGGGAGELLCNEVLEGRRGCEGLALPWSRRACVRRALPDEHSVH